MILAWFLYLSIALRIGWQIFSARGLESLNSGILRFFIALEKNEFRSSALSLFSLIILLSSTSVIFSFDFECQKVMACHFSETVCYELCPCDLHWHSSFF